MKTLLCVLLLAVPALAQDKDPNKSLTGCTEPCLEWDLSAIEQWLEVQKTQPEVLWDAYMDSLVSWGFFEARGNVIVGRFPFLEEFEDGVPLFTTDSLQLETPVRSNRAYVFKKTGDTTFVAVNPKYFEAREFTVNKRTRAVTKKTVPAAAAARRNPTDAQMRAVFPEYPSKAEREQKAKDKRKERKDKQKKPKKN